MATPAGRAEPPLDCKVATISGKEMRHDGAFYNVRPAAASIHSCGASQLCKHRATPQSTSLLNSRLVLFISVPADVDVKGAEAAQAEVDAKGAEARPHQQSFLSEIQISANISHENEIQHQDYESPFLMQRVRY